MRAQLQAMMPDHDEELQELCKAISTLKPSEEVFSSWFREIERRLMEEAAEGRTTWVVSTLPHLSRLCNDAFAFAICHPKVERSSEILAIELNKFCLLFHDYWCSHSDVKLTGRIVGLELVHSHGMAGLRFEFDWTPTAAESKQKKLKSK